MKRSVYISILVFGVMSSPAFSTEKSARQYELSYRREIASEKSSYSLLPSAALDATAFETKPVSLKTPLGEFWLFSATPARCSFGACRPMTHNYPMDPFQR